MGSHGHDNRPALKKKINGDAALSVHQEGEKICENNRRWEKPVSAVAWHFGRASVTLMKAESRQT